MLDKLEAIKKRYQEITGLLSQPEIIKNQEKFREYSREHANLSEKVAVYDKYQKTVEEIKDCQNMLEDPDTEAEFQDMLSDELKRLQSLQSEYEQQLRFLLLPQDPSFAFEG